RHCLSGRVAPRRATRARVLEPLGMLNGDRPADLEAGGVAMRLHGVPRARGATILTETGRAVVEEVRPVDVERRHAAGEEAVPVVEAREVLDRASRPPDDDQAVCVGAMV